MAKATVAARPLRTAGRTRLRPRGAGGGAIVAAAALLSPNAPPVIVIELPTHPGWFQPGDGVVPIRITVTDPDGDLVSADLAATPSWHGWRPIVAEPSGATRELLWLPGSAGGGTHDLVVRAHDSFDPARVVTAERPLLVLGAARAQPLLVHDFGGDARLDLLTSASRADLLGAVDCGALALFDRFGAYGLGPAPALLAAAAPTAGGRVGRTDSGDFVVGDVTGDGRADVISCDDHAALVWSAPDPRGGLLRPIATLIGSDPLAGFRSSGQTLLLADVTQDGILDLLAVASLADIGGSIDAGEVCLFAGGPTLVGQPAPYARLQIPGANAGDQLGSAGDRATRSTQGVVLADVTGDGVRDVIARASRADRGSEADVGVQYVWSGAALVGTPAPTALLDVAAAKSSDRVGEGPTHFHVVDLTGDGVLDVLVYGKFVGSGAWFLWHGGAALSGTRDADARLRPASGQGHDWIDDVRFHDFDHDGTQDLLAIAPSTDFGPTVQGAGSLYLWRGGPQLSGLSLETAQLRRVAPSAYDSFGSVTGGVQFADVTGDAFDDIVVTSPRATTTLPGAGAISVFAGSAAGFSGTLFPSAELQVQNALPFDHLGETWGGGCGVVLRDVTGDGVRDIAVVAADADLGALVDVGAAYLFAGGGGLTGGVIVAPQAELRPPAPLAFESFGRHDGGGFALLCGDWNGDGTEDVVVPRYADRGGDGEILLFAGGAALAGTPTPIAVLASGQPDGVGRRGDDFALVDVDGDRQQDLIAFAPDHDRDAATGAIDTGAFFLLRGGPVASGATELFESPIGRANAGHAGGLLPPRDLDGDGRPDLLARLPGADVAGAIGVGALLLLRSSPADMGGPFSAFAGARTGTVPPPSGAPLPRLPGVPEIATTTRLGNDCGLGE